MHFTLSLCLLSSRKYFQISERLLHSVHSASPILRALLVDRQSNKALVFKIIVSVTTLNSGTETAVVLRGFVLENAQLLLQSLISFVKDIQGAAKRRAPCLVNFVPAVAVHFCLAMPAAFTLPFNRASYRGLLYSAQNISKKDPGRVKQKSLATAITNFTKPGAQNKGDLCTFISRSQNPTN